MEVTSSRTTIVTEAGIEPPTHYEEIIKIQTEALFATHQFLRRMGLKQLMPVILSPVTDPLNHSVYDASINYLGQKLQLTKSMILHKQVAISSLDIRGIYIISPNVRLEKEVGSNRHLIEFSQLDIELKSASAQKFMRFMEDLLSHIFKRVRRTCRSELEMLGAEIQIPKRPFQVYSSRELQENLGPDFESYISKTSKEPVWITDYEREFYDREDEKRRGHYLNYDLVYPEGYGEALSGGERDYKYDVLVRKLKERGQRPQDFAAYLELARKGVLGPSAGGGIGIERLVRFLTKRSHIREVTLFPRSPGESITL
ncbi:MAG: asparagine synthetase A [Candidatus Thorarchaeota archaeon]|nr:asparagine synthetase A [Candidatus Thorarchaeota archaeon]